MSKTRKDVSDDSPTSTPKKSGHKVATGVIITLVVLVVFVLLTAFVWPGWATHSSNPAASTTVASQAEAKKAEKNETPTIKAKALPKSATELLKSMPDTVGTYARQGVTDSKTWTSASPLEEHTVVYSTGTASEDVTLIVAQWAKSDNAKTQYTSLIGQLSGKKIAAGNVKVSGQNTGAYEVHESAGDSAKGVAVWQNDTCVFQINGSLDAVKDFYQKFPL
ncbi:MAG: hypothetical protein LKJ47_02195 [Bifidobacteriaceae bacterium]|jgi:cytoskeletal protein RodZ|nr:hypothetical protein [Bifidobacteriaceae bacterium]